MKKTLRTVKAGIVMGILLVSIFAAFIPSVSAAGVISCQVTLKVEPVTPEDLNQLVEIKKPVKIPIKVTYLVTGLFADVAIPIFSSKVTVASISLSVVDTPSWVSASIEPNVVIPEIKIGGASDTAILSVSFNEMAPGRFDVPITIKMEAQRIDGVLFFIEGKTYTGTITVTPQFVPIIDVTPRTNFKEVSPGELVEFPIDLENLGNDITEFIFKIGDLPEGWVASMPANKKVDSAVTGGNPKATVTLSVTPPYNFGYHDETKVIKVYVKGQYYAKTTDEVLETEEYELSLQIRNRGFSTPGFEAIFVVFALIGIAFIVKKRRKTK